MSISYTATYSPEDNKLRLYASQRLDAETYARVKAAGFSWAPKQELFVAPMWTPERADICEELAGDIGDEDKSLAERAEERAGRFDEYSDNRRADSEQAAAEVKRLADGIPLGQPILVGHHSERHARKDAQRIENGMRKAVKMWETAKYWQDRAAGALAHASYKAQPGVTARRIKGLEADVRKLEKQNAEGERFARAWSREGLTHEQAMAVANYCRISMCFPLAEYPRDPPASQYEGMIGLWSALDGGIITAAQAAALYLKSHARSSGYRARWLAHYQNRLTYERAMQAESGGTAADKTGPEKGGACRCWTFARGWSYIQKVNKVSVTVLDNWGNGGRNFTRTIPFDKLSGVMSAAQVEAAKVAGTARDNETGTGFYLFELGSNDKPKAAAPEKAPDIDAMRDTLRAGITVQAVPQLFPTPRELAERVAREADITEGCEVLEPSAGTGALIGAAGCRWYETGGRMVAVEVNAQLCERLRSEFPLTDVRCADFLQCNGDLGTFDRIVMNPPFENGADIRHIMHARKFLKPGGRIVAICADGPRQQATIKEMAEESGGIYEPLPAGTFAAQGTGVNTALVVIEGARP